MKISPAALLFFSTLAITSPSARANLLEKDHLPEELRVTVNCRSIDSDDIPSRVTLDWKHGGREGGVLTFHEVDATVDAASLRQLFPAIVEMEAVLPVFTDAEAEATVKEQAYPSTQVEIQAADFVLVYSFDAKKRVSSEAACRKLLTLAGPLITAKQRDAESRLDCPVTGDLPGPGEYRWRTHQTFSTTFAGRTICRHVRGQRFLNPATHLARFQMQAEVTHSEENTKEATDFSKTETPNAYPSHAMNDFIAMLRQPVVLEKIPANGSKGAAEAGIVITCEEDCAREKLSIWVLLRPGTPAYALGPKLLEAMKSGLSKTQADGLPGILEAPAK